MNNSENNNLMPNGVVPNNGVQPNTPPTSNPVAEPVAPVAAPSVSVAPTAPVTTNKDDMELLEVAPPTVTPPHAPAAPADDNGDSRILKPVVESLEEEVVEKKEEVVTPQISVSESMSNNIIAAKEKAAMENRNMKEVKIEYKEPGFFRKFGLVLIIGSLIAVVFFLPDISRLISEYQTQKSPVEEPVEEKVVDGRLTCEKSDNDEVYDYIYSYDFTYEKSQMTSMNYEITTKGNVSTDVEDLTAKYNNCKLLSDEITKSNIGTSVSCDLIGATYKTSFSIDYDVYDDSVASPIFKKYKTNIPLYEYNQYIDDIEASLKKEGYTCDRLSSK